MHACIFSMDPLPHGPYWQLAVNDGRLHVLTGQRTYPFFSARPHGRHLLGHLRFREPHMAKNVRRLCKEGRGRGSDLHSLRPEASADFARYHRIVGGSAAAAQQVSYEPFDSTLRGQRDPEVLYWPNVFSDAWGTKANKPHFFRNRLFFLAWPLTAARPINQSFLEHVRFFALVPQASPKTFGQQKHFGIPLTGASVGVASVA